MWYTGELVLKSYLPFKLEEGMLFVNRISVGVIDPYIELYMLEEIPEDQDAFMATNGAPVDMFIIDDDENILAVEEDFAWWDEGPWTDELREISLDDINFILQECDGYIDIEISEDEEEEGLLPILFEDKIILRVPESDDDFDETLDEQLEE
jgi:hypothetical protein